MKKNDGCRRTGCASAGEERNTTAFDRRRTGCASAGKERDATVFARQAFRTFSILSGLGIYFVIVVGFLMYLGYLFDEHFGGHYGIVLGIVLGFPIAIYLLYRRLKKFL